MYIYVLFFRMYSIVYSFFLLVNFFCVVCLRKEETLVGRIQHFLSVCNEELVLVKWYGEVERDPQTRLWLCTGEEGTFISYVPITLLSRPLVHAWEDNIIWLLNYHDELL